MRRARRSSRKWRRIDWAAMAPSPRERPIYGISAVARMVDVAAATIRNWEDRYGLVRPDRSPGGHRLYSRDDVDRLRFVSDAVDGGATPAEAHRLLAEHDAADVPLRGPDSEAPEIVILVAERDPYAAELAEYLLRT